MNFLNLFTNEFLLLDICAILRVAKYPNNGIVYLFSRGKIYFISPTMGYCLRNGIIVTGFISENDTDHKFV